MPTYEGDFRCPKGRFALVASRFNAFVVQHLVEGAVDGLHRHGVAEEDIDIFRVPGSLEIPQLAYHLSESGKYVAIICLGAVIRGETHHFDVVANESAKGIAQCALHARIPIINAILTTDTLEQAINRAGAKQGNKGHEAASAAIEMANLMGQLPREAN